MFYEYKFLEAFKERDAELDPDEGFVSWHHTVYEGKQYNVIALHKNQVISVFDIDISTKEYITDQDLIHRILSSM